MQDALNDVKPASELVCTMLPREFASDRWIYAISQLPRIRNFAWSRELENLSINHIYDRGPRLSDDTAVAVSRLINIFRARILVRLGMNQSIDDVEEEFQGRHFLLRRGLGPTMSLDLSALTEENECEVIHFATEMIRVMREASHSVDVRQLPLKHRN
jgi:hypothetical protein